MVSREYLAVSSKFLAVPRVATTLQIVSDGLKSVATTLYFYTVSLTACRVRRVNVNLRRESGASLHTTQSLENSREFLAVSRVFSSLQRVFHSVQSLRLFQSV